MFRVQHTLNACSAIQVGSIGFCMGGALTLSLSLSGKIDCGAPCYGIPSEGHGEVRSLYPIRSTSHKQALLAECMSMLSTTLGHVCLGGTSGWTNVSCCDAA